MRWFKEQNRGTPTLYGAVPIVPAACIYDLGVESVLPPTADEAYQACVNAKEENLLQGQAGAGTGATVRETCARDFAYGRWYRFFQAGASARIGDYCLRSRKLRG